MNKATVILEIQKILSSITFVEKDYELDFTAFYYHQALKDIADILKKL